MLSYKLISEVKEDFGLRINRILFQNRFSGTKETYYVASQIIIEPEKSFLSLSRDGKVYLVENGQKISIEALGIIILGNENYIEKFETDMEIYQWIKSSVHPLPQLELESYI